MLRYILPFRVEAVYRNDTDSVVSDVSRDELGRPNSIFGDFPPSASFRRAGG
jgi:hypothetical protein